MKKWLIEQGTIVTMDPRLGELPTGDILVQGDRIVDIAPSIPASDAQRIDARGMIVIPGLINAHMHTWQTALRAVAANWTLLEYFKKMHAGLATLFTPEDLYIANRMGGLNQLNCGTTTLVDWCHNNPTPHHTDAAIDGLADSGVRAAFFHGSPKPDPKPGQKPFWEVPHPRTEIERLLKGRFSSKEQLLTLGMAILGPHYSTYEVAVEDFRLARELGLIASMHCAGGAARVPDGWDRLGQAGLLGDNNNIVHGNDLSDDQLKFMLDRGVTFSLTPETEMFQGHGFAITGRLRRLGHQPSLGVDLESCIGGDMFTVARMAMAAQRGFDNAQSRQEQGKLPDTSTIPAREALGWVTSQGARMLKMQDRIGSLTPGKQADLVLVRASDLNMQPVHDPITTVVTQTSLGNIDTVMVAGELKKFQGRLLEADTSALLQRLHDSGHRIMRDLQVLIDQSVTTTH